MRILIIVAALYGLTAVVLGAFGAHALKARLNSEQLVSYETGIRYQLLHALLILVIALWARQSPSALLQWAGSLVAVGIALFSFSIYMLATRDITGLTSWKWLGPITPLGGLLLISGWVLILVWAIQQKN